MGFVSCYHSWGSCTSIQKKKSNNSDIAQNISLLAFLLLSAHNLSYEMPVFQTPAASSHEKMKKTSTQIRNEIISTRFYFSTINYVLFNCNIRLILITESQNLIPLFLGQWNWQLSATRKFHHLKFLVMLCVMGLLLVSELWFAFKKTSIPHEDSGIFLFVKSYQIEVPNFK